jgi:hypothetical protein
VALTVKHVKVSAVPDGLDAAQVQPSDWNAFHTLAGSLDPTQGGTGLLVYAVGDLLYADTTTSLARRAAVAAGSVLVSGGVGAPPVWSATPTFIGTNITAIPAANLTGTITPATQDLITRTGTIISGVWQGSWVGVEYGGTGADLWTAGGPKQFVKQLTLGGPFTVGTAAITDMSDVTTWPGNTAISSVGTVTVGTWSALFGAVSGANLTNLSAGNLTGTITPATQDLITRTGTVISGTWSALFGAVSGANLTNLTAANLNGALPAANFPALTGDVTTTAGTLATAIGAGKVTNAMLAGLIDATTKLTGIVPPINGGTGNGFTQFAGPSVATKTFNLPNASATILTDAAAVTAPQGGTGFATYTIGDLLYASGAAALSKLAAVAIGSFLYSTGVGSAPVWSTLKVPNATTMGDLIASTSINTLGSIAAVATGYLLASNGAGALPIWTNTPTISSFINANHNHSNAAGGGQFPITNLVDVLVTAPVIDQVLKWNGTQWVNGVGTTASAGPGLAFFDATPFVITAGVDSATSVLRIVNNPVTTAEQTIAGTAVASTVLFAGWVTALPLARTSLTGGVWTFATYCGVDTVAGGRVTTITRQMYNVLPFATGTVTITGSGTSRIATASAGTPFAVGKAVGSATNTVASYLQTPNGLFQITAVTGDTTVVIATLGTYTNEVAVAGTVWLKLFGYTSSPITAISPAYTLMSENITQSGFVVSAASKLGELDFVTSNSTTILTITYNGTTRNTFVQTPLATAHNNLEGLQGGVDTEYYHLTAAEYATITGGVWTGSAIDATHGGTGFSSYTIGDLLYASGTTTLAKLADVAAGSFLRSGGAATAPAWSTLVLPNAATQGDLLIATATNTVGALADVAVGQVLVSGGVGVVPAWSSALTLASFTATSFIQTPQLKNAAGVVLNLTSGSQLEPSVDLAVDLGELTKRFGTVWSSAMSATTVSLGAIPATAGTLRLPTLGSIQARNAANSANLPMISVDGSNNVRISGGTQPTFIDSTGLFSVLGAMAVTGALTAASFPVASLTGTTLPASIVASSLTSVGTITAGTWSGSFGAVSGANLTSLTAANISAGTAAINISGNSATTSFVNAADIGGGTAPALSIGGSAPANLLSGTTLASGVTSSSLTSLGSIVSTQGVSAQTNASFNVLGGAFGATVSGPYIVVGANTSGAGSPGMIQFRDRTNIGTYMWIDTTGVVRVNLGGPPTVTTGDLVGGIVGAQTSTLDVKRLLSGDLQPADALATILVTPIKKFKYKNGAYSGTEFHGIITDLSPEFAMDAGRCFNPVSAFGYTVQSIKELNNQIELLKAQVAALSKAE